MQHVGILSAFCSLSILIAVQCSSAPVCRPPIGNWTTGEGQELFFRPDGKGIWVTSFGRMGDTVDFEYKNDCDADMPILDLLQLSGGPYLGKTLFGIIDWQSDSVFRWRFEPGNQSDARPMSFDVDHTIRFKKK